MQTKSFVKGSARDEDSNINNAVAGIAASLAVTAIAIGLLVTRQQQPSKRLMLPLHDPGCQMTLRLCSSILSNHMVLANLCQVRC